MSATARKFLASFAKLNPKDRKQIALEILRRVKDDGLELESIASAEAFFLMLDEEEAPSAKR